MSSFLDVAGTVEEKRKEKTPKESEGCDRILGHTVNNCMTVICSYERLLMGRYPMKRYF